MRRIQLVSHLTTNELEARYRRAHEPTERSWWQILWQILWLLSRGQTTKPVAESTGYSRYWIGQVGAPAAHRGTSRETRVGSGVRVARAR